MVNMPDTELYKIVGGYVYDLVGEERFFKSTPDFSEIADDEVIVYLGATSLNQYTPLKGMMVHRPSMTIHIFGGIDTRDDVEELKTQIYDYVQSIQRTENYQVDLEPIYTVNSLLEEIEDNLTLWHGTLDVTFRAFLYGKDE